MITNSALTGTVALCSLLIVESCNGTTASTPVADAGSSGTSGNRGSGGTGGATGGTGGIRESGGTAGLISKGGAGATGGATGGNTGTSGSGGTGGTSHACHADCECGAGYGCSNGICESKVGGTGGVSGLCAGDCTCPMGSRCVSSVSPQTQQSGWCCRTPDGGLAKILWPPRCPCTAEGSCDPNCKGPVVCSADGGVSP